MEKMVVRNEGQFFTIINSYIDLMKNEQKVDEKNFLFTISTFF